MAAYQEISWPPARTFVAAYKENLMAADTCQRSTDRRVFARWARLVRTLYASLCARRLSHRVRKRWRMWRAGECFQCMANQLRRIELRRS